MKIIESTFDPISLKQLDELKQIFKETHKDIYCKVSDSGYLSKKDREKLLKQAFKPYKHFHVYTGNQPSSFLHDYHEEEEKIRSGKFYLCAPGIQTMIHDHGYYYENVCEAMCNEHRAIHSKSVAKTASLLASYHQLDETLAYRMGLLHDITKKMSDEDGKKILEIYDPDGLKYDPKVWHSFTAVIICKKELCIYDSRILNAIYHHTLGDGNSDYDHILYIADKIEPTRGYDATYEYSLAKKSLKECAYYVREKSKKYILEKEGKHV